VNVLQRCGNNFAMTVVSMAPWIACSVWETQVVLLGENKILCSYMDSHTGILQDRFLPATTAKVGIVGPA